MKKKFSAALLIIFTSLSLFAQNTELKRYSVGIKGLNQKETVKWRQYYLQENNRVHLSEILYNSTPYRPYIISQLKKRNMPLCLQYLPVIESEYKVKAVSKSGATGLWQFMENSMAPYMTKSWWYDERYDPWKETDAALSKLQENYKTFGDWTFALAAYNVGAGAMKKIIKAHPGKDFWWLCEHGYIRKETADYVPKFLAVCDVIMNAEYWGCIDVSVNDKRIYGKKVESYDYLKINFTLTFDDISKASGISEETLKFLNPALIHYATPPKTYLLRLPKDSAKEAAVKIKSYVKK